jgi:hypothetical protein
MSNFIARALGALGYYHTPRHVLAVLDKPRRDPYAPVAANPPFAAGDDDADLARLAAELWRECDELDEEEEL